MIVLLSGGLGNQMFQYALAYALSRRHGKTVKLDAGRYERSRLRKYQLGAFDLPVSLASKAEVKRLKYKERSLFEKVRRKVLSGGKGTGRAFSKNYYREPHYHFDPGVFAADGDLYFDGYWQSERYFSEYREELLQLFSLKSEFHPQNRAYDRKIRETESVSLHIRRTDYVTVPTANKRHGVCSVEYYRRAISEIKKRVGVASFFVFSDDLEWAKENITFIDDVTFVKPAGDNPDHEELILMSRCRHHITANSSFSWWGAWLNRNPNKIVIAPAPWFRDSSKNTDDLVPSDWIQLQGLEKDE